MINDVSTLSKVSNDFINSLTGSNISPKTITAYTNDIRQYAIWTAETSLSEPPQPGDKKHISEY